MLYVGIDQHKCHLTMCARDDQGQIVWRQQVSTVWAQVDVFLERLQQRAAAQGGVVCIMEVCGFNGWLIERLRQRNCRQVYLVKAPERVRQKTDRRDAARLSELLWLNRERIAAGQSLVHVKEVYQATAEEQQDRQLVRLRQRFGRQLTRSKNRIKHILRRHNLEQECPTKELWSQAGWRWLQGVRLPQMDRLELKVHQEQYSLSQLQLAEMEVRLEQRAAGQEAARILRRWSGVGAYTALALAVYIGPVSRFKRARSLSNFFGLVPSCCNSGQTERMGRITGAGNSLVRHLLGQLVVHVLRTDAALRQWYRQVKRRRGVKTARVAVMRRLCEALWHMLQKKEDYQPLAERKATCT